MARSSDALARATANSAAPASRSATTSRIFARSTVSAAFSASTSSGRSAMLLPTTAGNHTALVCGNYVLCSKSDIFRFIPLPADARFVADVSSRSPRARASRNVPSGEPDESLIERVRVLDPHHPLYGRTFCVIRRLVQRGGNYPASYEVEYYNGASLLIPVSATEHNVIRPNLTKLSIEALRDLIVAAECLERDEHRSKGSLGGTASGSSASDRGRRRRSSGGDLS